MATPPRDSDRYHLPARIRSKRTSSDALECQLNLADRISGLPGMNPSNLFCKIDADGIVVRGLTRWDKYQVLCRGWGRLERDYVLISLPRDNEELEICWGILQRAYSYLSIASTPTPAVRETLVGRLPRFSRTTLQ